jgi:hypothetical protein
MTLQDLGGLGELIGAVAVVLSLAYLAVQVRQNTRALNARWPLGPSGPLRYEWDGGLDDRLYYFSALL